MIEQLTPLEAWRRLQEEPEAVLIDVRCHLEHEFVGHPVGAVLVPWKEPPTWQVLPDFPGRVRGSLPPSGLPPEERPLLLICRSGHRSQEAAEALAAAGFRHLANVVEGFEGDRDAEGHRGTLGGWRFHGLPWVQG
ncbi:MAG: rhodanese-like domain-containing protein [Gammaproteobacteria bacterium]|nr:MAG: rhodanese-like domain-containing protein [Gammaproteobacteria bacterium]